MFHKNIIQGHNVTGFRKPIQITHLVFQELATNLKYLTHCKSLLLGCNHVIFAV